MNTRLIIAATVASLTLSSCANVKMADDTATPPPGTDGEALTYATWVSIGDCAFGSPLQSANLAAPLADALLGGAINAGIDALGAALKAAGEDHSVTAYGTRRIRATNASFGPCMQVARGWFYENPGNLFTPGIQNPAWLDDELVSDSAYLKLWKNGLWLAAQPDFFFEGVFAPAAAGNGNDAAVIALYPDTVWLNRPLFTRSFNSDDTRHLTVAFAFANEPVNWEAPDLKASLIDLRKLEVGASKKRYLSAQLDIDNAKQRISNDKTANYYPLASIGVLNLNLGTDPANLFVSAGITELQDGNAAAAFLGEVIAGNSAEIKTAAQTLLIPSKRAAAQDTAATNYNTKLGDAITALAGCQADGSAANAAKAINAMILSNAAARAAGKKRPFTNSQVSAVQLTGPNAATEAATQCAAILDNINS